MKSVRLSSDKLLCLLLGALWVGSSVSRLAAQTNFFFTFDTLAGMTNHFKEANTIPLEQNYIYSSSLGVGGVRGRVEVWDGAGNDALVFLMPISWVQGAVVGISALVHYTNTSSLPGVRNALAVVGLLNSNNVAFNGRAHGWASLDAALVSPRESGAHHLALRSIENLTVTTSLSPPLSLSWGWYELAAMFRLMSPESFGYAVRLDWRGQDGTALPETLASLEGMVQNTRLFAGGRAYLGLAGGQDFGALAFDNVYITIPEPCAGVLLGLGGGLLVWSLCRRANRRLPGRPAR